MIENDGKLAVRTHEHAGSLHVFAASLQNTPLRVSFLLRGKTSNLVHTAGEQTPRQLTQGRFVDEHTAYGIRHYRIHR